mgnify:CR=1 FL=1|jgi:hypothetical protein
MNSKNIKIQTLKNSIEDLLSTLPYADGPAYYQDKRRLADLREQLRKLEQRIPCVIKE